MALKKDALQFMGIEELFKEFNGLTDSLQRNVLRKAVAAGGTALASSIRKVTPRSRTTGTAAGWSAGTRTQRESKGKDPLRRAIKKKPSSKWKSSRAASAAGIIGVTIGHDWLIAPHSWLVNYGHRGFYWSKTSSGERVAGTNYFQKGIENATAAVRSKVTTKARAALAAAVEKQKK